MRKGGQTVADDGAVVRRQECRHGLSLPNDMVMKPRQQELSTKPLHGREPMSIFKYLPRAQLSRTEDEEVLVSCPACVLLFSLQVLAANRADSRSTEAKSQGGAAETVELFDAIKSGDIEVRVIAKDNGWQCADQRIPADKPLAIKLPEAFAAVPVTAQFGMIGGGPFGGGGNPLGGGNLFGGGGNPFGGGGVGFNNGLMGQGGANQALGGGFQGQNGVNGGNAFNLGNGLNAGNGRGFGMPGGLFKVEPDKVGKLKMTTVCMEYGKPDPDARQEYIAPAGYRGRRSGDDGSGEDAGPRRDRSEERQAATWHLCNGLSWEELEKKIGRKHLTGQVDLFFTPEHLAHGKEIAKEAHRR